LLLLLLQYGPEFGENLGVFKDGFIKDLIVNLANLWGQLATDKLCWQIIVDELLNAYLLFFICDERVTDLFIWTFS